SPAMRSCAQTCRRSSRCADRSLRPLPSRTSVPAQREDSILDRDLDVLFLDFGQLGLDQILLFRLADVCDRPPSSLAFRRLEQPAGEERRELTHRFFHFAERLPARHTEWLSRDDVHGCTSE